MRSSNHPALHAGLVGIAIALFVSPVHAALCSGNEEPVSCHALAPTAAQAKGGGTPIAIAGYPPLGALAGALTRPATKVNTYASDPELITEVSAGAWGSAGREPIVAATVRYELKPASGLFYLNNSASSYTFSCDPTTDALCFPDGSVVRTARGSLTRRYRVVKTPGAQLPADVTSAPILVDYEVHFRHLGSRLGSAGTQVPAPRAQASVKFGNYSASGGGYIYNGRGVDCGSTNTGALQCNDQAGTAPTKGTLSPTQVGIGEETNYYLRILALASRDDFPYCKPRVEYDGDPCLVDPWSGSATVVTDPYVYVDPSWPHAALVRLEMAEDEAETTWVTPQRTPLDFDNMKLLDTPPPVEADAGGTGEAPRPGAPGPGPNDPPAAAAGTDDASDGGCALSPTSRGASGTMLLLVALSLLVRRAKARARRS
jgi:hypothetical protein